MDLEGAVKVIEAFAQRDAQSDTHEVLALGGMAATLTRISTAVTLGEAKLRARHNMRASGAARLSQEAIGIIVSFLERSRDRSVALNICRIWRAIILDIPGFMTGLAVSAERKGYSECYCEHEFSIHKPEECTSTTHRLNILSCLPGILPVPLSFFFTAHCDLPLTPNAAAPSRRMLPDILHTVMSDRGRSAAPRNNLLLELLNPLTAASHRIVSITLDVKCSNWLLMFICLPQMTALRSIDVTAKSIQEDDYNLGLPLPHPLLCIALLDNWPEFPVTFPVLETLRVSGISCKNGWRRLRISTGRVATLLRSMPQLRRLDLDFTLWPTIVSDAEVPAHAGDEPASYVPHSSYDNPHLRIITLEASGKNSGDVDCDALSQMMRILPVNPGSTIRYKIRGAGLSQDNWLGVLGVLYFCDFIPTTLCIQWKLSWCWRNEAMRITAWDDYGNERAAATLIMEHWNGGVLLQCVDTSLLTRLVIDDVEWDFIADGFEAPVLEDLEVVLDQVAHCPPPTLDRRRINLPSLRRVTFTLDDTVKKRGARTGEDATAVRITVPVAILRSFLVAALPAEGHLESVAIKDPAAILVPIEEDGYPIDELGQFARSVEVL